jgi:hypothetical protein
MLGAEEIVWTAKVTEFSPSDVYEPVVFAYIKSVTKGGITSREQERERQLGAYDVEGLSEDRPGFSLAWETDVSACL